MLTITPEMILDLYEYDNVSADKVGIVLTDEGWSIETWLGQPRDPELVAFTRDDLYAWADGTELTEDDAEAILDDVGEDFRIFHEDGEYREPRPGETPQVVVGRLDGRWAIDEAGRRGEIVYDREQAWWFDYTTATLIIEPDRAGGDVHSLYLTAGGRWVWLRHSVRGYPHDEWVELTPDQVAEWVYYRPDLVNQSADLPPLVEAALKARELVDLLEPPRVRWYKDGERRYHRADLVRDESVRLVRAAGAVSELLRRTVLADIRGHRADAARNVVLACDGQEQAAEKLGISRATLANLVR